MDKQKEKIPAISLADKLFSLTVEANEAYSLSNVLTQAFSCSKNDPTDFVPALRVLTGFLHGFRDKIAEFSKQVNN